MLKKLEKFLFYLFIFSIPFQTRVILYQWSLLTSGGFNEWSSAYLYFTDILLALIFILWFWRSRTKRFLADFKLKIGDWLKNYSFWLIVFAIISFISIAVADNFWLGFYQWIKLLEFIVLFFYLKFNIDINDSDDSVESVSKKIKIKFRQLVYVFLASGLVQSCIAVFQYTKQSGLGLKYLAESPINLITTGVAKIDVDGTKIMRAYGTFPHPNVFAAFLLINIFFLYYIWTTKKHSFAKNCLLMIAYFVFLFALLLTFSRVVIFITLCLSLFYFAIILWQAIKNKDKSLLKRLIFIFFVLTILCLVFISLAKPEVFSHFKLSSKSESFVLRKHYNETALSIIADYPLLGVGMGNFVWNLRIMFNLLADWTHQPVHNIYLLIASETGLISLIVFLMFVFILIKKLLVILKNSKKYYFTLTTLLFLMAALLLVGLTDHFLWTLQQGQIMFWLVLGLVGITNVF